MPEIDVRLNTSELSPTLRLQTELASGTILDIELAKGVTANGSPDAYREFARDLLDLVDMVAPQPRNVLEDIPPQSFADEQDQAGDHQHRDVEGF